MPELNRRRVLVTSAVLAGVAGCSSGPSRPAPVSADVASAIALVRRLRTSVALTRGQPRYAALAGVERAHLAILTRAVPADRRRGLGGPVASQSASGQVIRSDASGLHGALVAAAVRAESGEFAALLASMAAGIGQQVHLLGWAAA